VTTTENWPVLAAGQQIRVMDKAQLGSTSGYEIMVVTADANGTGVSWTATRGVEGTTPVAHAADWTAVPANTAGLLNGLPMRVIEFTTSGQTWTVPDGITQVDIEMIGGGGGGSGGGADSASGNNTGVSGYGGGGGQWLRVIQSVVPGETITATAIGAGAAPGTGSTAIQGNDAAAQGGTTTVSGSSGWSLNAAGGGGAFSSRTLPGQYGQAANPSIYTVNMIPGCGNTASAPQIPWGISAGGVSPVDSYNRGGGAGAGGDYTVGTFGGYGQPGQAVLANNNASPNGGTAGNGQTPGAGGGGGGVAGFGGTGGTGGYGAAGQIWIRY